MKTNGQKSELLRHKGYTGTVEPSLEDECLMGRVLHIDDIVSYEGETVAEIKQAFKEAVDRYLAHCKGIGKVPNKPYGGTFNVRIGAGLHRELAELSHKCGSSINELVVRGVQMLVDGGRSSGELHIHITTPEQSGTAVASTSSPRQLIMKTASAAHQHGTPVH